MSHSPKVTQSLGGKPDNSCKGLGTVSGTFQDDLKGFLLPKRIVSSSGQGTVVRETLCTQEWEEISHKQYDLYMEKELHQTEKTWNFNVHISNSLHM